MYMVHLIRDYLDLIRKFTRTEAEKRGSLEDQQTHLRTGLDKLLETQSQVTYTSCSTPCNTMPHYTQHYAQHSTKTMHIYSSTLYCTALLNSYRTNIHVYRSAPSAARW